MLVLIASWFKTIGLSVQDAIINRYCTDVIWFRVFDNFSTLWNANDLEEHADIQRRTISKFDSRKNVSTCLQILDNVLCAKFGFTFWQCSLLHLIWHKVWPGWQMESWGFELHSYVYLISRKKHHQASWACCYSWCGNGAKIIKYSLLMRK